MITTLSVTATPGKGYTFSTPAGTEATTALSVMATPGGLRTFAPKVPPVVPTGQITELTVWAIPGKRRYFIAKTPYIPPEPPATQIKGGGYQAPTRNYRAQILREDEEILAVIMAYMETRH